MNGDQRVRGLIAEGPGEHDFLFRRIACRRDIGRTEMCDELLRELFDQSSAVRFACLYDLHQRRPAEGFYPEKCAAKRRARLAFELSHVLAPEYEGAGHRPFARLGG